MRRWNTGVALVPTLEKQARTHVVSRRYVDAADEAEPPAAVEKKPERKLQAATVKPQNLGTGKTQRSSYAEMRQKQDLEPWVKLEVIPGDDPRGTAKRARLALAESEEDEEEDEEG